MKILKNTENFLIYYDLLGTVIVFLQFRKNDE